MLWERVCVECISHTFIFTALVPPSLPRRSHKDINYSSHRQARDVLRTCHQRLLIRIKNKAHWKISMDNLNAIASKWEEEEVLLVANEIEQCLLLLAH